MRLTLRTLLAYLDEILEPEDTQDIAKKVEESEFATQLVHRTRDCMRRLRLGVPPVLGRGLAADPNTVAEYLDNTLSSERVAEFEKICLESDVHLAEVAACHQILTLVLGGAVDIPVTTRQRMYGLAAHVGAPPIQGDALRPSALPPPVQSAVRRAKPEVPEYLRQGRSRYWPLAATVVIAALLTFGGLVVLNPGQLRERILALGESSETDDSAETTDGADATAAKVPSADATPGGDSDQQGASGTGASPDDAAAHSERPADALAPPLDPRGEDPTAPPAPEPADMPAKPEGDKPAGDPAPAENPDAPGGDAASKPAVPPVPEPPAPGVTGEAPAADPAAKPEEVGFGRYTSKHEVLLRLDTQSGDWKRLPAMAALAKGDRLLSLPAFRPTIMLSSNITLQPEGAALVELAGWTDQGVPIVQLVYGRFLLMTVGKAGNAVQVAFDDSQAQLTFVDAESTLALEARRVLPPGRDPGADAAPLAVELYVTSGLVRVRQDNISAELQAPLRRPLVGSAEGFGAEFPKWPTSADPPSDVERLAATTIEPLLVVDDRPIGLKLKELATNRRREVRSLAIRSACYLDDFESCVAALNDPQEKALWNGPDAPCIAELRAAVARSPETAARVRATLDKQRGTDAGALYRMLWGYSADDLKNGADRDLVEGLENDSLDNRVLALWNLQHVTGNANLGYYPGDPTQKRRQPLKKWQAQLREGKIVPKSAAAPSKSKSPAGKSADRQAP